MLVEAGVTDDPSSFGLHSMRRGAATSAVNNGASDHSVQKQMRVMSVSKVRQYSTLKYTIIYLKQNKSDIFNIVNLVANLIYTYVIQFCLTTPIFLNKSEFKEIQFCYSSYEKSIRH